ncbi:MAG: radical SAM protein [Hyalangium sp.]|uniref:radical SAM protein n=1 Tax=Hyalangium sp. TaxID=2028555 RepID=UPI0038998124
MTTPTGSPYAINWDVTYACPLRCIHCYSESGRRAASQLSLKDMLRVTEELISLRPASIQLSGGEPLLVKGLFQVAERISQAGIPLALYTSGWLLEEAMLPELLRLFTWVHVSVDGATAGLHDAIRGRPGSFKRALRALTLLDGAVAAARQRGDTASQFQFGIDCVVVRSNFARLEEFCTELAPRFPQLSFLTFQAAIPSGLATRPGFVEHELLTDEQAHWLASDEGRQHLSALVPGTVQLQLSDSRALQMHPEHFASGTAANYLMHVEADGAVRSMAIYEGTVGRLLEEPASVLWERALQRHSDPFVIETLTPVRTMKDWAEAARRLDSHFGSEEVRARIARRPDYFPSSAPAVRPPIISLRKPAPWRLETEPSQEP